MSDVKPTLLVLAAGMGSRYGGLKQMDEFGPGGESIIDYSIYDAIRAGFGKVVFVVRNEFLPAFKEKYQCKFGDKIEVVYVAQEVDMLPKGFALATDREKPWGTAHAVWVAKDVINEPFAVINADDFYGRDAFEKMADFLATDKSTDYCMVAYYLQNTLSQHGTVNRGVCSASDHYLISVTECVKIGVDENGLISYPSADGQVVLSANALVSMNFWGFKPSYFNYAEEGFGEFLIENKDNPKAEYFIPLLIDKLISDGELRTKVLETDATWFGVTYPEDKPGVIEKLNKLIEQGEYPNKLWN